jgi:CPA1 family monovalent cation:H+ antiporter
VFLLIGDQIHFQSLLANLDSIAITIVAMLITRALAVYGLSLLANGVIQPKIPLSEQTALWWGGLRGSVSIALALSVPIALEGREEIIATVFGVVLFTLLVQGLTMKPVLERLELLGDSPLRQEYDTIVARRSALERVLKCLVAMDPRPDVDTEFYRYQMALIEGQMQELETQLEKMRQDYPQLQQHAIDQVRNELLAIEADTYAEFVKIGRLNKELSPLLSEVLQGD